MRGEESASEVFSLLNYFSKSFSFQLRRYVSIAVLKQSEEKGKKAKQGSNIPI